MEALGAVAQATRERTTLVIVLGLAAMVSAGTFAYLLLRRG